jgi:hypothetical protein
LEAARAAVLAVVGGLVLVPARVAAAAALVVCAAAAAVGERAVAVRAVAVRAVAVRAVAVRAVAVRAVVLLRDGDGEGLLLNVGTRADAGVQQGVVSSLHGRINNGRPPPKHRRGSSHDGEAHHKRAKDHLR